MQIALIAPIIYPVAASSTSKVEYMVHQLATGLFNRDMDVTLFSTSDSEFTGEIVSKTGPSNSLISISNMVTLQSITNSCALEMADQFDLIHNFSGILADISNSLIKADMVSTISENISGPDIDIYAKLKSTTNIVTTSRYNSLNLPNVLDIVPPAVNPNHYQFSASGGDYILYLGPVGAGSGALEAIEAASKLKSRIKIAYASLDAQYYTDKLEANINRCDVELIPNPNSMEINQLLCGANVCIQPGNICDGPIGLSIIESFVSGTPVISFGNGFAEEFILSGSGYTCVDGHELASYAEQALSLDRSAIRDMAMAQYSTDKMVDRYLQIYRQVLDNRENHRPWGHYENLVEDTDHKLKRIVVAPGSRLSYQKHNRRAEHWVVIRGKAIVTLDGEDHHLNPCESIDIPAKAAHRVSNPGDEDLWFAEVQFGDYFGEDDIIRLEDDYGRSDE